MHSRGFTLVELLLVISIISLLSAVVFGNVSEVRDRGRIAAGQQFEQSLKNALGWRLVGEWTFDDGSISGGVVDDLSGNERDCTQNGSAVTADGVTDHAIAFDGTSGHLDCGPIGLSENQVSLSWWMKLDSYSGLAEGDNLAPIIFDWMAGSAYDYRTGTLLCYVKTNPTWSAGNFALHGVICTYSTGVLTPNDVGTSFNNFLGKWYHVAFVVDGQNASIYVNGVLEGQVLGAGGIVPGGETFAIGHRDWNYGVPLDGSIDDVRIYEEALSLTDIQRLYAEGLKERKLAYP